MTSEQSSRAEYHRAYEAANREKLKARRAAYYVSNKEKYRVRAAAHYERNREAFRERSKQWLKDNPERAREWYAKYYAENKERYRERERIAYAKNPEKHRAKVAAARANNPERAKAIFAKWRANNLDVVLHHNALRRTRKRKAQPAWANLTAIRAKYKEAERLKKETGLAWHVDHVVPLKHPLVCGLHCEFNLCVIPGAENQSKGNGFIV